MERKSENNKNREDTEADQKIVEPESKTTTLVSVSSKHAEISDKATHRDKICNKGQDGVATQELLANQHDISKVENTKISTEKNSKNDLKVPVQNLKTPTQSPKTPATNSKTSTKGSKSYPKRIEKSSCTKNESVENSVENEKKRSVEVIEAKKSNNKGARPKQFNQRKNSGRRKDENSLKTGSEAKHSITKSEDNYSRISSSGNFQRLFQGTVVNCAEFNGFIKAHAVLPQEYNPNKDVFFRLNIVKSGFLGIVAGDKVEFVLGTRDPSKPMAIKVTLIQCNRGHLVLEKYLSDIIDRLNELETRKSDTDGNHHGTFHNVPSHEFLLSIVSCLPVWKCLSGCSVMSDDFIHHLLFVQVKLEEHCQSLQENFREVIQIVSQSKMLDPVRGRFKRYISSCIVQEDGERMTYARKFLLLLARYVPEKLKIIPSLMKPMVSKEDDNLCHFLYEFAKQSVKHVQADNNDLVWDDLSLVFSPEELQMNSTSEINKLYPVKVAEPYTSPEEYMDVYFRLLRAECNDALKRGIQDMLNGELDPRDMAVYSNIHLVGVHISPAEGSIALALKVKAARNIRDWDHCTDLMYGNLLGISVSGSFYDTIWASVLNKTLMKTDSIVLVQLCSESNTLSDSEAIVRLQQGTVSTLMVESPTYYKAHQPVLDAFHTISAEKIVFHKELFGLETPEKPWFSKDTITFDSNIIYNVPVDGNLDFCAVGDKGKSRMLFEDESLLEGVDSCGFISQEQQSQDALEESDSLSDDQAKVIQPGNQESQDYSGNSLGQEMHTTKHSISLSLEDYEKNKTSLFMKNKALPGVIDIKEFLKRDHNQQISILDESQEMAVKQALEHRIAIIQGPPGTGKTFIGIKLVQMLLSFSPLPRLPILVLTYKNHILDEFLKTLVQLFPKTGEIVRIGGRSEEETLSRSNLNKLVKESVKEKHLQNEVDSRKNDLKALQGYIKQSVSEVDNAKTFGLVDLLNCLSKKNVRHFLLGCDWSKTSVESLNGETRKCFGLRKKKKNNTDKFITKEEVREVFDHFAQQAPVLDLLKEGHIVKEILEAALEQWLPDKKMFDIVNRQLNTFFGKNKTQFATQIELSQATEKEEEKGLVEKCQEDTLDEDISNVEMEYIRAERMAASTGKSRNLSEKILKEEILFLERRIDPNRFVPRLFTLAKHLTSTTPVDKVLESGNLWKLSPEERVKVVQYIMLRNFETEMDQLQKEVEEFKLISAQKRELENQQKVKLLKSCSVVGMTITGASINHQLLKQVRPAIVIVEEAAEILEAQLFAAIGDWTKYLVMIGDHQQLRPQVDSYHLARKFNMDISMFERLIKGQLPYSTLKFQSRMRPEFADLILDIYPDLENNLPMVSNNVPANCIKYSSFFWDHEDQETGGRSYTNDGEARRAVRLALFLLQSGYKTTQITILSAYKGQTAVIRRYCREAEKNFPHLFSQQGEHKEKDNEIKLRNMVAVHTIDMYQGDENDFVIVSLVRSNHQGRIGFLKALNRRCVAQSRSRCGLYFIGNTQTLSSDVKWKALIDQMSLNGRVGKTISLQCPNHQSENVLGATSFSDIKLKDFCKKPCPLPMDCTEHQCPRVCQPSHSHNKCRELVNFEFSKCGHSATKKCYQNESQLFCQKPCQQAASCGEHSCLKRCQPEHSHDICEVEVNFKFSSCGHETTKKCYQLEKDLCCQVPCPRTLEPCGHPCDRKCGQDCKPERCKKPCEFEMDCRHPCPYECGPKHSHAACNVEVNFKFTSCGHDVTKKCSQKEEDIRCKEPCPRKLEKCGHPCGLKCGEVCDPMKCNRQCEFEMNCGHRCWKRCRPLHGHDRCEAKVEIKLSSCGHAAEKLCYMEEGQIECRSIVKFTFKSCGHNGEKKCYQNDDDFICKEPCTRRLSGCGHLCELRCGEECRLGDCRMCAKKQAEKQKKVIRALKRAARKEAEMQIKEIKKGPTPKEAFREQLHPFGDTASEYFDTEDRVKRYIQPGHRWHPVISKIEKVTNYYLELKWLEEKRNLVDPTRSELKFHGTNADAIERIINEGFRKPQPKNQMYGPGIYFASDSSKSAQDKYTQGSNMLLLCEILLGNSMTVEGPRNDLNRNKINGMGYDSVYAKRDTKSSKGVLYDEYVVYSRFQAIPRYIIHYTRAGPSGSFGMDRLRRSFSNDKYQKFQILPQREIDLSDPLQVHYRLAEAEFLRMIHRTGYKFKLTSVDYYENSDLVSKFEAKHAEMRRIYGVNKESKPVFAFHGTPQRNIEEIMKENFSLAKVKRTAYGHGIYFSEFPDVSIRYGDGLILSKVLPGKSYICGSGGPRDHIQSGYDSHIVEPDGEHQSKGKMLVIGNPDQILPCYVIHFSMLKN